MDTVTSERKGVDHIRTGLGHARTGLGNIRTMRSRMDRSKIKTPQGALMEMGRLSQERKRLGEEMAHWERRTQQIKRRLAEIAEADKWLHTFISQAETSEQKDSRAEERRSTSAPRHSNATARSAPDEVTLRY